MENCKKTTTTTIFWNIGSINRIYDLTTKEIQLLTDTQIISLVETWHTKDLNPPGWLRDYGKIDVKATKGTQGRPKGGIILYISKDFVDIVKVKESENHVVCKAEHKKNNEKWIIAVVYIQPDRKDFETILEHIIGDIDEELKKNPKSKVLLQGDFNARIGVLDVDEDKELFGYSNNIKRKRANKDHVINWKGKILCNMTTENQLHVLNGRTEGDMHGEFTFVNSNGKSTIDLIMGNEYLMQDIKELKVLEWTDSDHFPIRTRSCGLSKQVIETKQVKLTWDSNKVEEYKTAIETEVTSGYEKIESYEEFMKIITKVTRDIGLEKSYHQSSMLDKKWFDKECRVLRRETNDALRNAKKTSLARNTKT